MPLVADESVVFVQLTRVHGAKLWISVSEIEAVEERRSSAIPKDGQPARSLGSFVYTYRREYIVADAPEVVFEKIRATMRHQGDLTPPVEDYHGIVVS